MGSGAEATAISGRLTATPIPMASQRASPTISDITQNPPHAFFIDIERIKWLSVPFQHPIMPFVPRVKHGFEKLHEAVPAAYVLGRAAPRAIYECGIVNIGFAVAHALDYDVVNPVVTEIIDVFEPVDAAIDQGFQAEAFGSINLALIENIVGIGFAINLVADPELEQVRIAPSHRYLDDVV